MGVVDVMRKMVAWNPFMENCAFATSCWEKDWRLILLDPEYLQKKQIEHHCFPFSEKLLVINNVADLGAVKKAADAWIGKGVLTRYVVAEEIAAEMLSFFELKRSDFQMGPDAPNYLGVNPDWIYYNALGPLAAIYSGDSDYLLYLTGDVRLDKPIRWIEKTICAMKKEEKVKVANLVWNERYDEARQESYKKTWNFFYAKEGFSDQMFLVKRSDFKKPIYGEIRSDSFHFPRGDVFEKRIFSYMKNRLWERMIFRRGSYTHENVT